MSIRPERIPVANSPFSGARRLSRRDWIGSLFVLGAARPIRRVFSQQAPATSDLVLPRWREFAFSSLSGPITPAAEFFLRSHLNYPRLTRQDWALTVEGLVQQQLSFRFEDLLKLPRVARIVTFECSGNPPGGGMVSTAAWGGTSLRQLLDQAGVLPAAKEVILEGADFGLDEAENIPLVYARSIPLEKALAPEPLIVWEMNGQPLPPEHGFPARAVVPGHYAMSHVKWLSRIRLTDRPYKGFYMTKRYFTARRIPGTEEFEIHPEIAMKVKAQIARPASGEQIFSNSCLVAGAAWTGEGRIAKVEVSADGGITWGEAELLARPAAYAWVLWRYRWAVPKPGRFTLVCRAVDEAGAVQPEYPDSGVINRYGNNWYHRVEVTVRRG